MMLFFNNLGLNPELKPVYACGSPLHARQLQAANNWCGRVSCLSTADFILVKTDKRESAAFVALLSTAHPRRPSELFRLTIVLPCIRVKFSLTMSLPAKRLFTLFLSSEPSCFPIFCPLHFFACCSCRQKALNFSSAPLDSPLLPIQLFSRNPSFSFLKRNWSFQSVVCTKS